jgi:hypothetical protein
MWASEMALEVWPILFSEARKCSPIDEVTNGRTSKTTPPDVRFGRQAEAAQTGDDACS